MGLGYDTVEMTFSGQVALGALVIVAFKWIASATGAAMGLPAGLIGPTLVISSCAGGALGIVGHSLAPELSASPALYAMLGMGYDGRNVAGASMAFLLELLLRQHHSAWHVEHNQRDSSLPQLMARRSQCLSLCSVHVDSITSVILSPKR